jgi:hypothetical protein
VHAVLAALTLGDYASIVNDVTIDDASTNDAHAIIKYAVLK